MMGDFAIEARPVAVTREALSKFRTKHPDCVLALWVDIEARVVLAVDSDLRYPQESLDTLCSIARHVLTPQSSQDDAAPDSVIFAEPTGNRLVLRDGSRPTHALICTSAPHLSSDRLLHAMKEFLSSSAAVDPIA